MSWSFPWARSFDGDLSNDFGVADTEERLHSGATEDNF